VGFTCHSTPQGLAVSVLPHSGPFTPWWNQVSIEVYGASRPARGASIVRNGAAPAPVTPGFDPEHHRITAVVPDDGKGLELQVAY
jgi:alpha-glucosidase